MLLANIGVGMEQIYAASTILSCLVFILQTLYTTISSNNSDQKCHYHGNESAYRLYSTRTVYGVIHNESADLKDDPPQGCVAQGVYMVSRHGTRFPVIEEIKRMQALLPKIEQDILPHLKKGRLCSEEIQALEQWHLLYQSHVDMNMNLADVGIQEMYGLGNRMQKMFPELLDVKNHNRLVFKHTGKPRVHQSTAVFIQGLSNVAVSSPIDEVTESYNMEDLSQNKRLLESIEVCKRNKISFKTREEEPIRRFDAGYQMLDLIASVEARLGLPHDTVTNIDIDVLYDICRYDYAIYRVSPWCAIFNKENLRLLEYRQDLKYLWRYGFVDPVNYESSCVLVSDLLQYFKNHSENNNSIRNVGHFHFGHSRTLLPFYTRLGLFFDDFLMSEKFEEYHEKRKWRLSYIDSCSSNIVFILYACEGNFMVKTLVNEKEIVLPFCASSPCSLTEIFNNWSHIAEECNFENICSLQI